MAAYGAVHHIKASGGGYYRWRGPEAENLVSLVFNGLERAIGASSPLCHFPTLPPPDISVFYGKWVLILKQIDLEISSRMRVVPPYHPPPPF